MQKKRKSGNISLSLFPHPVPLIPQRTSFRMSIARWAVSQQYQATATIKKMINRINEKMTDDKMVKYAEHRNRETGRRIDFVQWVKIYQTEEGKAIHVGAELLCDVSIKSSLGGCVLARRGAALEANGITLLGPVVIKGSPVEITYEKPLAFAMNTDDPCIVWFAQLSGIVSMDPPQLNDVVGLACNPKNFDERQEMKLVQIPLKICPGDRVSGVAEQVHSIIGEQTIALEIQALMITSYGGICPYYLAKEWEPKWLDGFLKQIS